MAAELRWTARARREINSALGYLKRHEPDAIEPVARGIMSQALRLISQPHLSAVFQRTPRGEVRETLAVNYRIFYRVHHEGTVVRIISVRHARRKDPAF